MIPLRTFRLFFPRVVVEVDSERKVTARPDALALFVLFMTLGAVVVELTLPRAQYPRDYPAAFPFAMLVYYVGAIGWELKRSLESARRLLDPTGARG
ncbi:MAG: hypothetical protein JNK82_28760 [Myxococcaceae bacterium]|nr:hypothetical protein [Myxococcaceae bacterium]